MFCFVECTQNLTDSIKNQKFVYNKSIESGEGMRKLQFKKILSILDAIEIQGIAYKDAAVKVYDTLANEYFSMKMEEIKQILDFLKQKKLLKDSSNGIDLSPAATVYAKSNQNSGLEALSIFESFIHDEQIFSFYQMQAKENKFINRDEVLRYIDHESFQFMTQTSLFEYEQDQIRFHPKLMRGIQDIVEEYRNEEPPLVSVTLTALYTSTIVAHEDLRIDYKNTNAKMIDYEAKHVILSIIPRKGIPHDRDETKALQSFYKDTLFHEFDHACPICNISIAHMLIASHIKPFRDCAHIFEAIDHNNGLLLCRNHDYLFDQGYISFDDRGYIIISEELLNMNNLETSFVIHKNYRLNEIYLTKNRRLFLQYHREHILKKSM